MRVGITVHSGNPRGGVVHAVELADALIGRGIEAVLFVPSADGTALFRGTRARVVTVPVPAMDGAPLAAMVEGRIAAVADALSGPAGRGIDLFHAHDPISANALDRCGLPFVRTVHHIDPDGDPRIARWQARAVVAARAVFVVSRLWREAIAARFGRDAVLVGNGCDTARFSPRADATDAPLASLLGLAPRGAGRAPVFLALGGIEARKNTVAVLSAFAAWRARNGAGRLLVAGGASLLDHGAAQAAFGRVLAGLDAETRAAVRVIGVVDEADMPALYRLADALLCPSLAEGFGLCPLEAMACGTPVVLSDLAPFDEHLGRDEAVWVDPADPGSIEAGLARAVDPRRAAALASGGPAVASRFGWDAVAAHHIAPYRHAIAKEPACA